MKHPRTLVAAVAVAFLATAGPATAAKPAPTPGLDFQACGEAGAQCAAAQLPRDYDRPNGPKVGIAVSRSPATDPARRIGALFFNFGGPGASAADYVEAFGPALFPVLNERFDIVGVDPRGTGASIPLDCKADQERIGVYAQPFFTAENLDQNALIRRARTYVDRCTRATTDIAPYVSTANVARDFNAVRELLGERQLTYLGFSYGTFLGATLQSLFPDKTRAVVLDGALDPDQYINRPLSSLDEQTSGFERAINRFAQACSAQPDACGFGGGDALLAIDTLIDRADATPLPASQAPDRPVDGDDLRAALVQEVYSKRLWPELAGALARAQAGDGSVIRAIVDGRFYGRNDDGTYDPALDRYFVLGAAEQRYPRTVEPYIEAGIQSSYDYEHAFWNHGFAELNWGLFPLKARDAFYGPFRTAKRAPTTLVVGTRYDPATTYGQARRMTRELGNARLLTLDGDGHTAYDGDPSDGLNSPCIDTAVEAYLFDLEVPAPGTRCKQDQPAFPAPEQVSARRLAAAPKQLEVRPHTRPLPQR
jgi:pimeloyl-ACP methyl ester carboxylesterase